MHSCYKGVSYFAGKWWSDSPNVEKMGKNTVHKVPGISLTENTVQGDSVIEHLPNMSETLCWIPSMAINK